MSETEEKLENREAETDSTERGQPGTDDKTTEEESSPYEELDPDELVELLEEKDKTIEELNRELTDAEESRLRKAAELENVKKRIERERSQIYRDARASALEDFLPVNDDLRRTLKAFENADVNENFMDGVNLVASKFEEVLKKHGIERIDEEMVPFDVDLHDAMMRQKPEDESIESDIVLKVLENGYRIGDRTIRHAKVIVSE